MELIGVILAAGKSTRMAPFSDHYPKPVLPIMNRPVLYHQLVHMKELGITKVIIVVSHLGFEIVRQMEKHKVPGIEIHYVDQGQTLGIAHALGKLEQHIDSPFLLMLGDIYFICDSLQKAFQRFCDPKVNAVLVSKYEDDPEAIKRNFAIIENSQGYVRQVIEKPRYVENNIKGCGLYFFDQHIFDAIRRTPRTAMRDEYEITDSIQILINDGFNVAHFEAVKADINLTEPRDLLMTNQFELNRLGLDNLIHEQAVIEPDSTLEHCVVGPFARIGKNVTLKGCTVFAGAVIEQHTDMHHTIFTPFETIHCQ